MPKVVHLYLGMFDPPTRLTALTEMSALDELVLIGTPHFMADGRLAVLREALAPRRMVALLIDDHLPPVERALVDDLLNDGLIPVILVVGRPSVAALTSWIERHDPPGIAARHRYDQRCGSGARPARTAVVGHGTARLRWARRARRPRP